MKSFKIKIDVFMMVQELGHPSAVEQPFEL